MTYSNPSLGDAMLAHDVRRRWGVDDAVNVITHYGAGLVNKVHKHLLDAARAQKLAHVKNLSGYFMQVLRQWIEPDPPAPVFERRDDEFIGRYLERQRARGNPPPDLLR